MKPDLHSLLRYPTLWLQLFAALLTTVVSLNLGLSAPQAGALLTFTQLVVGAINAWAVRPIAPAVFVALLGASAGLLTAFGVWTPTPEQLTALSGTVTTVVALISSLLTTPVYDPAGANIVTASDKVDADSL